VLVQPSEGGLTVNSVVLLNQIRSIDKQRLVKRLGKLTDETMGLVNQAIQVSLGLIEI
jgi:mRNA interferase MazF